jgi:monofunctional biosynthetic peptidoglycan transglycosylase
MTALMVQRAADARSRGAAPRMRQQWVRLGRVSDHLQHAMIVAEDGTFYEHGGVDWFEVRESIKRDFQKRRFARGASTITQQLAKNLFLSTSKDPVRKLKEYILSGQLESALTKNRILELYLNVIEWGDGVFGAEAAALTYFGKHAADLTREEAAQMAAVVPSPLRYSPSGGSVFVARRSRMILARMSARGW